ncbi:MAG: hypothetical protein GX995_01220 [Clostridiales bacterium]|nr:hypothetical protein [Clostridiales bacterium]
METKFRKFILRIVVYIIGLFFLALGVAFSINSGLGVSPVNSLPYVISLITGVEIGTMVIIVFSFYILVQILVLRKDFKWINLTQIIFSTIFGYFTNFTKMIVGDFTIPTYFGQLLMLAISIVFIAVGVSLYVDAKLVNMPMEGMVAAINEKLLPKKTFADVKVIMDTSVVIIGIILSFVFLGKIEGIREGTIICALVVGKLMKPMQKRLIPKIEKLCF